MFGTPPFALEVCLSLEDFCHRGFFRYLCSRLPSRFQLYGLKRNMEFIILRYQDYGFFFQSTAQTLKRYNNSKYNNKNEKDGFLC